MMKLSEEQQAKVREWAAQGASLNDIHKRIVQELGVAMTYMEARLLVADLEVSLKDKNPPAAPKPPEPALAPQPDGALEEDGADLEDDFADLEAPQPAGSLTVSLDAIANPRTLASGRVTFSDGAGGNWYIDEMGRLGLDLDKPGYRPSEADVRAFQRELQTALQRAGY